MERNKVTRCFKSHGKERILIDFSVKDNYARVFTCSRVPLEITVHPTNKITLTHTQVGIRV